MSQIDRPAIRPARATRVAVAIQPVRQGMKRLGLVASSIALVAVLATPAPASAETVSVKESPTLVLPV
jgi:hypothetical protein